MAIERTHQRNVVGGGGGQCIDLESSLHKQSINISKYTIYFFLIPPALRPFIFIRLELERLHRLSNSGRLKSSGGNGVYRWNGARLIFRTTCFQNGADFYTSTKNRRYTSLLWSCVSKNERNMLGVCGDGAIGVDLKETFAFSLWMRSIAAYLYDACWWRSQLRLKENFELKIQLFDWCLAVASGH